MCGIAGFITTGSPPDRSVLRDMCARIRHRGPDGSGAYFSETAALGHQRLSIIDLNGGAQPLGNEDGSVQVIFNGEIYNYRPLRAELERKGHRFASNSDTEVLVHLYEEAGDAMAERLNGMFAFAIWDNRSRELLLCRDRVGKKPLYYSLDVTGYVCCFASELKALRALPEFEPEIDPASVADFLAFSYVPDPRTVYRRVSKLPPAHTLRVSRTGARLRRYWRPLFRPDDIPFDRASAELEYLAEDAVASRLMSDVPLGAFLSGGVDSSAVVGIMSGRGSGRTKTFSIGFDDPRFDELRWARLSAARHQTDHEERVVTPDVGEMLDVLARQFDEPFGDPSAIPTLYLARMTREHVTVALSGDGADEVFGGYRRYRHGAAEERVRASLPGWARWTCASAAHHYPKFDYLPQIFRGKTFLGNLGLSLGEAYFVSMSTFRDPRSVLSPDMTAAVNGYSPREAFVERFRPLRHLPALEQMQAVDFETWLPGDILVKADRATMAYSLESRSPWLDYRLVELGCRLPSHFKVNGSTGKHIFKKALAKYVPEPVISRRKMGFSVPLASWFRTELKPVFESAVFDGEMEQYVHAPAVRRIWAEHQTGLHNHDRKLWNLLVFANWQALYAHSEAVPARAGTA